MDLSHFSLTTEKLVKVFYKPLHCDQHNGVTMLCTRFTANNRYSGISDSLSIVKNNSTYTNYENSSSNNMKLHLSKQILDTTNIKDDQCKKEQLDERESQKINTVLQDIGLVVIDNSSNKTRMFTLELSPPTVIYYKHNIPSYSPNRYSFSPITKNSVDSSVSGRYNTERNWCTSTPKSSDRNLHEINEYRNYHKAIVQKCGLPGYKEKGSHSFSSPNKKKFILKYWSKRHILFSKFDLGILLDDESFYSVCPEVLSYHIAKRCRYLLALDPFCGAGGNIIQLALVCDLVIAIDIDPNKIAFAKHNAKIYGVDEKIEFIIGDFFTLAPTLKADVVFMSPPWGGPDYSINENFTIGSMCAHHYGGGYYIFKLVKNIAPNIAFHLPKTTYIFECLWLARNIGKVEIQQNIINGKLDSITAFYGEFTDITDYDY